MFFKPHAQRKTLMKRTLIATLYGAAVTVIGALAMALIFLVMEYVAGIIGHGKFFLIFFALPFFLIWCWNIGSLHMEIQEYKKRHRNDGKI